MRVAVLITLTVVIFNIDSKVLFAAEFTPESVKKEWASTQKKGDLVSLQTFLLKYPRSEYAKIARKDLSNIEFTVNRDGSILVTKGFDYHNEIVLGSTHKIEIERSGRGILFTKDGPPFIPRCAQPKEDRQRKRDFEPVPDAVGTKWKFIREELFVFCTKNESIFLFFANSTNATIEFSNSGVLLRDVKLFLFGTSP